MKTETAMSGDALRGLLWQQLEICQELLDKVPEREQRFNWQNIANLRGMFRKGPNGLPAPIEQVTHKRLTEIHAELNFTKEQIQNYLDGMLSGLEKGQNLIKATSECTHPEAVVKEWPPIAWCEQCGSVRQMIAGHWQPWKQPHPIF